MPQMSELIFPAPGDVANAPRPLGRPEPEAATPGKRALVRCDTVDHTSGMPAEASGLQWPATFLPSPVGERLELSEDGARATRQSGVGRGICFVGPLQAEKGSTYFEVEVLEMDGASRSQTMALGLCTSLPSEAKAHGTERASNLGQGSYLMGYDLPKLFVHGQECGKIPAKEWRPLRELCAGDRVGLLVERPAMELTVFVNGKRKASMTCPPGSAGDSGARWPGDVWGVVDVYGTVKSVRLRQPESRRRAVAQSPAPSPATRAPMPQPASAAAEERGARAPRRAATELGLGEAPQPAKRPRLSLHPCGCTVHLIRHTGCVVHVPGLDFIIGRNPKSANLTLDSTLVPNMVSRKHARILSTDDGVEVVDCESLNGTWVNDAQVNRHQLRQGDVMVIGKPAQGPADFRFTVSLPAP